MFFSNPPERLTCFFFLIKYSTPVILRGAGVFFMLKRKGFTLIEMLVVVLIIAVLAAIAFPQYQLAVLKSRYTQLMIMGDALRKAQDAYYLVHGKYALKINDLDIQP